MKLDEETRIPKRQWSRNGDLPKGILDVRSLPDPAFLEVWESIIIDPQLKTRLAAQAILNFTVRPKFRRAQLPLHGIILLVGPPGTGKTSLARGLAAITAKSLKGKQFTYLEVEPHGLASASLGKSQQAVKHLVGEVIPEYAQGPLVVVLDEVETLATDRAKLSLDANPVDVHRATDAVLAQLDQLAESHPELLFIATSNYPKALDGAFVSRADLVLTVGMPNVDACEKILESTLQTLALGFPNISHLAHGSGLRKLAKAAAGLDGRRIRKAVFSALTFDKATALDPSRLSQDDIFTALTQAQQVLEVK